MDRIAIPSGFGAVLALLALIIAIVLMVVGGIELKVGGLIALCAASRLC